MLHFLYRVIRFAQSAIPLFLFVFAPCLSFAANPVSNITVSGYVTDKSTGEVLIGAGVVPLLSQDRIIGAVTNEFGFYSLTVPSGELTLRYSYVGYAEQTLHLQGIRDTVVNVALDLSLELKASTVVSSRDSGIESTYMGALEVPQTMIRNMPVLLGEADVLKTLQMMPGVSPGSEGSSGFYVRGGAGDENLVMLDGASLYNVSHLFGLLSVFTPEAIKKVTFYKGSFPARYGGRASSIVDVRTNDGNVKGFHGSVSAGLLAEKLHLEGPLFIENTTFSLSGRGMHTFLLDRIIRWAGSPANYAFYDLNAKLTHNFGNSDRVYLGFYHGRDYFRFQDKSAEKELVQGSPGEGPYTTYDESETKARMNWGNTLAVLRWNHVFGNNIFSNISASWNMYEMLIKASQDDKRTAPNKNTESYYSYGYNSGIRDVGLRADFDYTPVPSHMIKFGAEYVHHLYRPDMQRVRMRDEDNDVVSDTTYSNAVSRRIPGDELSLYVEDDMRVGRRVSLTPGFRLSMFSVRGKYYVCPEPRLSGKYDFGKGWYGKAAYSRMSQYVHQLSSGVLTLPTDLWVPITQDIRPVTSDLVSLGGYFNGLKGWEFSIEGYYKRTLNVLEYKDGGMAFMSGSDWEENVEMGNGRSYGAELYMRKTQGRTTGSFSYTLSKSERIFPDGSINNGKWFPFMYDRRHNICLSVNQKLGKRIDLSAVWVFMSGNWMTIPERKSAVMAPDGESFMYYDYVSSRNNFRLPPTHRLDISVNFHKKKKHGERIWNVGMYNVYGARNPNLAVYDDSSERVNPSTGQKEFVPAVDIYSFLIFIPSFSYTFKF